MAKWILTFAVLLTLACGHEAGEGEDHSVTFYGDCYTDVECVNERLGDVCIYGQCAFECDVNGLEGAPCPGVADHTAIACDGYCFLWCDENIECPSGMECVQHGQLYPRCEYR